MLGWFVLFMVILTLVMAAIIITISLVRPKQHDHASKISGYNLIECSYQHLHQPPTNRKQVTKPHLAHKAETTVENKIKLVESKNWSGYVVSNDLQNPRKNAVTSASARWVVPRLLAKKPTTSPRYASIWVGLDGYDPKSVSEQQIGTQSDWDSVSGQQVNYAWFRVADQPPTMIVNFPIVVGDSISAGVKRVSGLRAKLGQFQMTIRNNTQGVAVVIPSTFTIAPQAQCKTAQFIVEAPSEQKVLPLADFGAVHFHECVCTVDNIVGSINTKGRQYAPIHMVTNTDIPILTTKTAQASPLAPDGKSFTVAYL